MVLQVTKIDYRQGTSFARGTTIDAYISQEACDRLYELWQLDWPEKLEFPGRVYAITAEMILEVPEKDFMKVFRKARKTKLGQEILQAARANI